MKVRLLISICIFAFIPNVSGQKPDFMDNLLHYIENKTTYQLKKQNGITFNLDYATTGVGSTDRGVFNSYQVAPSKYEKIITIYPVNP